MASGLLAQIEHTVPSVRIGRECQGQLRDHTTSLSEQALELVGFSSLVLPGVVCGYKARMHRTDHFIESSDLLIVGVKRSHALCIPLFPRSAIRERYGVQT